ncbi:signal peptide peptidase SppA [Flavipsychrobacter stenotrophus]|uniref:Signal peptide peptidase SppA n=1 Tax=Flavipsychrobacter stenotrophus TaxID=2077091 RepID=A0A2S7SWG2_9BACT|nr:signal peptide peptidase SppA [Flavipsychrobacter stenotrophus]PQJ10951.1 signal peptide peptidase SppA [Flavipsychrobacter stenotrophus]
MKEFFKMFFASFLAMFIAGIVSIGLIVGMIAAASKAITENKDKTVSGDVLVIDLSNRIHESGESNSFAMFSKGSAYDAGLYDITKALNKAKSDNEIKGILLKLSPAQMGWATLQQLRTSIADFKTSGKFVYAYGEDISQGAYFVASSADSIYLNPAGGIDLKGFATTLAFFKGALDKLELQPEIFYAGKFKSATEPFRADKISDPNRQQITEMQASLWNEFTAAAAQYMHTDAASVNKLAVDGTIQFPADALKHNMVAGLLYWDEVEGRIKRKIGHKDNSTNKYITIDEYVNNNRIDGNVSDNRVAVLIAEGEIVDGEQMSNNQIASKTFCDEIRKVAKDDKIKAVVLRVNSPGGSALASEVILRELNLLKQKKHLIVSMGDYAASGGYYISANADSIFAQPSTITGSIGVFSMMFNIDKLMKNKLGVTFDGVKNAPYADLPSTSRPLTAEEAKRMQNSVDTIYALFKNHVVQGRKLSKAEVDSIAQGRVWTGSDALKIHLVDRIGGLSNAIASAAGMAGIKDYKVVTFPEPEDKLNTLLRKLKNNTSASAAVKTAIKEEMGSEEYQWYEQLQSLRKMHGKALMAMPFVMSVR